MKFPFLLSCDRTVSFCDRSVICDRTVLTVASGDRTVSFCDRSVIFSLICFMAL